MTDADTAPPQPLDEAGARDAWDRLHLKGPDAVAGEFDFQQVMATRNATDPAVGSLAPDFDLPVLDSDGERVQLSAQRGRPVALIFGSYT
ncbi:MAG TPA: hypothetical protein QGF05_08365 [Dehalococcoidia bacterium]|nr:hypothetical protein [Dehalococcoidia bacterium]